MCNCRIGFAIAKTKIDRTVFQQAAERIIFFCSGRFVPVYEYCTVLKECPVYKKLPGMEKTSADLLPLDFLPRLFQPVREKHGLCYSIGSFTAAYKETGMLAISTAVGRDSEEKALALIREEIEKFRQDGITDKELRTARELIKSSIILSLESSSSRMNRLGSGLLLLGKCLTADEIIERYDAVTGEEVLALAREMLVPEKMGFSAVGRLAPAEDYLSVFGK